MLVKNIIRGCSTGQIDGLSLQLLDRIVDKGYLVRVDHPLICCEGRHNNPYLQKSARDALIKAVEKQNTKIIINSCLRTPMQQYMLRQQYSMGICGITAAAPPGRSNHQSGLAIDVQDYSFWRSPLRRVGWIWIGAWDKWHFDYKKQGINLGSIMIREFQELWNENNSKKLATDGSYGSKTGNAIANSPIAGFGNTAIFNRGDISKEVGKLQIKLRQALGLTAKELSADCKFGGQTTKAVMAFQRLKKLRITGIADEKTLKRLGYKA